MKYEWKKHDKKQYGVKQKPSLIDIPKQQYIMISGKGNPNDTDFSDRVAALYSLAYAIKMAYKKNAKSDETTESITDFTVYPLEGVWTAVEDSEIIKENLEYTLMIRQPDYITAEMVDLALASVKKKKPNRLYAEIFFDTMTDGPCIEVLHVGPFDDEPESFKKMDSFAEESNVTRAKSWHREIYLNNANRVDATKLKTILRYTVE